MAALGPFAFRESQALLRLGVLEPANEAGDLGVGVQRDELIDIRPRERAQEEPLGLDNHEGSLTPGRGRY